MIPPLLVIMIWPIVAWILFRTIGRSAALCWCLIGGYLILPTQTKFDLPLLPAISKTSMPSFAAVLLLWALSRQQKRPHMIAQPTDKPNEAVMPGLLPRSWPIRILFFMAMTGVVLTVFTNRDPLVFASTQVSGLRPYDAFSQLLTQFVELLPLLLARKYLASPEQHRTLLVVLCLAMLIYSLPAFWEIRMSPQLNFQVYGFRNGWGQHVRAGGFRPLVFLDHSLWMGIFIATSLIATFALVRVGRSEHRRHYLFAGFYLLVLLYMAKTIAALAIALLLLPMVFLFERRLQLLAAAIIAGVVLLYPMARGAGLVPVDKVLRIAESIDVERAQSFGFRLRNEDILLEKAKQRPLAGWGSWGRNRVYDENGKDISVTDGRWVIEIGSGGWVGYISRFGMLTMPILLLFWRRKTYGLDLTTTLLCLVLCVNLIDLIPNATLTPITWLLAGALIGRLEYEPVPITEPDHTPERVTRGPRYARPRPLYTDANARAPRGNSRPSRDWGQN